MANDNRRLETARWYILVALDAGRPTSLSERTVLRALNGALDGTRIELAVSAGVTLGDLSLSKTELRRELRYLETRKLVALDNVWGDDWSAELTAAGVDLVEYTTDCRAGIARPPKR